MKKMLKNILFFTLSLILVFNVFACNNAQQKQQPNVPYIKENQNINQSNPQKNNTNIQQPAAPNSTADEVDDGQSLYEDEMPNAKEEYQVPTEPIILLPKEEGRKLWHEETKWMMTVSKGELLEALAKMNIKVATITPIMIDTTDELGCCAIISIGGKLVNAYELCEHLKMPSSYITGIEIDKDAIIFEGRGSFEPLKGRIFPHK